MSGEDIRIHCPYNVSHCILRHRMASHLIKCRQQYPSNNYVTCPFDSTHDVLAPELQYHTEVCPNRKRIENLIYIVDDPKPFVKPPDIEMPPSVENWDEEGATGSSYLDVKDEILKKELIFRQPVGLPKTSRKEFYKNQSKRFESSSFK